MWLVQANTGVLRGVSLQDRRNTANSERSFLYSEDDEDIWRWWFLHVTVETMSSTKVVVDFEVECCVHHQASSRLYVILREGAWACYVYNWEALCQGNGLQLGIWIYVYIQDYSLLLQLLISHWSQGPKEGIVFGEISLFIFLFILMKRASWIVWGTIVFYGYPWGSLGYHFGSLGR